VAGAIAVETNGVGHVAYVVAVSGANVIVDDANWLNDLTVRYSHAIPQSHFQGYIYGGPAGNGPSSGGTPPPTPGQTLAIVTPLSLSAPNGFIEFQPLSFAYTVKNVSGSPASIQRFSVPVRGPAGDALDVPCANGDGVALQAGQTFTCTASLGTGYGSPGTFTYWADWQGYDSNWHTGQLGPMQQFTLAAP
jgi:hypothetical protein